MVDIEIVSCFSKKDLQELDKERVPKHIAFINDGNRRWAKERGLPALLGHRKGAEQVIKITEAAQELGVKALTFYAFSTENWNRSSDEVTALMHIFHHYLKSQKEKLIEKGVRLEAIGNHSRLPPFLKEMLDEVKEATKESTTLDVILAIDYGSRDEIVRAMKRVVTECLESKIKKEALGENLISSYLDTARWPDPDLLIRTSGEYRLSNFLLWQLAYAEVYTTNTLWPDFNEHDFLNALLTFQQRKRRYGN